MNCEKKKLPRSKSKERKLKMKEIIIEKNYNEKTKRKKEMNELQMQSGKHIYTLLFTNLLLV